VRVHLLNAQQCSLEVKRSPKNFKLASKWHPNFFLPETKDDAEATFRGRDSPAATSKWGEPCRGGISVSVSLAMTEVSSEALTAQISRAPYRRTPETNQNFVRRQPEGSREKLGQRSLQGIGGQAPELARNRSFSKRAISNWSPICVREW
jgi:hypothetical protein